MEGYACPPPPGVKEAFRYPPPPTLYAFVHRTYTPRGLTPAAAAAPETVASTTAQRCPVFLLRHNDKNHLPTRFDAFMVQTSSSKPQALSSDDDAMVGGRGGPVHHRACLIYHCARA